MSSDSPRTSAACNCDPDTYEPHAPWCAKGSDLPATSIPYEGTDCTPEEAVAAVKAVRTSAAQPLPLDPFTMATRMCDDDGMVSETVAEDMQGLANQELRRLTYLDKVNNMRRHGGSSPVGPFACTGSAHLAGEHIRCTSPAHGKQPEYDQQSGWTSA